MIRRAFALKLFDGFSVQRWNDIARPYELVEMDKAAEKTVLAYLFGKYEESIGNPIDWDKVIYGSLFELLKKIALSDIKAPVHRMIKERYPDEFRRLNEWVVEQYKDMILDDDLISLFSEYMTTKEDLTDRSFRVLRAAHKYSTLRELYLVKPLNRFTPRMSEVEVELNRDLQPFLDLEGLQRVVTHQPPFDFLSILEGLRFQTRWNQTPRIPRTSVLGHSFFVAVLTLLMIRDLNPCPVRTHNAFFCALFHDLPEAVTRDIISPVKQATDDLPSIVKEIEDKIVSEQLLPTIDPVLRERITYYTNNEFENRIRDNGEVRFVEFDEIVAKYNRDEFDAVDGKLIKVADHMAAFLEAERSITFGISSPHLSEGRNRLHEMYARSVIVNGTNVSEFYADFERS